MAEHDMVRDILWADYYKIAWVNILTGEYEFVKYLDTDEEKPCLAAKTIYEYSRLVVSTGLIPPDDIEQYQRCTDRQYILREVMTQRKRITVNFRRLIGTAGIKWVRLEIVLPQNFSESNPWAVYTWKESDAEANKIEDAMRILSKCFHKILKVNLDNDTFSIIKAYPEEVSAENGFSPLFSEWLQNMNASGLIYPQDIPGLKEFIKIDRLKKRFRECHECLRLRYRRKFDNVYRWVYMELIPSIEYTPENPVIMLYVRDIHDDYVSELHRQKALEYFCNYDTLTGLHSRFCYNNFCRSFEDRGGRLAVLFADINGLKFTNDTKGHECGDQLISSFAELLGEAFGTECCYRISGDEFVVLAEGINHDDFYAMVDSFRCKIKGQTVPAASVGAAWCENVGSVDGLVKLAETRMYSDKQEFYKLHPEMKR